MFESAIAMINKSWLAAPLSSVNQIYIIATKLDS